MNNFDHRMVIFKENWKYCLLRCQLLLVYTACDVTRYIQNILITFVFSKTFQITFNLLSVGFIFVGSNSVRPNSFFQTIFDVFQSNWWQLS